MKSGPQEPPSSHWTIEVSRHSFLLALILFTIFHWLISAFVAPAEDELYYWAWAQNLKGSYFDHPPLVAYLIRLSTMIFGNNLFGIRFFSCVSSFYILWVLRSYCRGGQILTFVLFTPVFALGSILMTPDTPLLFFWTAYIVWVTHTVLRINSWNEDPVDRVYHSSPVSIGQWAWGGLLLGLGCLSKYTMFVAIPCSFVVFFLRFPWRGWAWGYFLHLFSALIVFSPVLIFNYRHDWVSFRFQWENAMQGGGGFAFSRFFEFLGSQVMLAGALPFLLFGLVWLRKKDFDKDARLYTCFWFFVLPFLFFIFQSFRNRLEANWALVTYLAFWPLAQRILEWTSFKALGVAVILTSFFVPLAVSAVIFIHLVIPLKAFPVTRDRIYRLKSQYQLAKEVAKDMKKETSLRPLFLHNYQEVSYFRFLGVPAEQIYPAYKSSEFTMEPKSICELPQVWFFTNRERPAEEDSVLKCFKSQKVMKQYPFKVRNEVLDTYYWVFTTKMKSVVTVLAFILLLAEIYSVLPPRSDSFSLKPQNYVIGGTHIYSNLSEGSGTVSEIAEAAEEAGYDFIVITDTNTTEARRLGFEKRQGKVDVFVEMEVTFAAGHALWFTSLSSLKDKSDKELSALAWQHYLGNRSDNKAFFCRSPSQSPRNTPGLDWRNFPTALKPSVWTRGFEGSGRNRLLRFLPRFLFTLSIITPP